jgi:hypothetical protein
MKPLTRFLSFSSINNSSDDVDCSEVEFGSGASGSAGSRLQMTPGTKAFLIEVK